MTSFADAMQAVLSGNYARRDDWHRPLCIYRSPFAIDRKHFDGVWMEMRNGRIGAYVPSQCDMLANDWIIFDEKPARS